MNTENNKIETGDIVKKIGAKAGKPYLVTSTYESEYQSVITIECLKTGKSSVKDMKDYKIVYTFQYIASIRNNYYQSNTTRTIKG